MHYGFSEIFSRHQNAIIFGWKPKWLNCHFIWNNGNKRRSQFSNYWRELSMDISEKILYPWTTLVNIFYIYLEVILDTFYVLLWNLCHKSGMVSRQQWLFFPGAECISIGLMIVQSLKKRNISFLIVLSQKQDFELSRLCFQIVMLSNQHLHCSWLGTAFCYLQWRNEDLWNNECHLCFRQQIDIIIVSKVSQEPQEREQYVAPGSTWLISVLVVYMKHNCPESERTRLDP